MSPWHGKVCGLLDLIKVTIIDSKACPLISSLTNKHDFTTINKLSFVYETTFLLFGVIQGFLFLINSLTL